MRKQYPKKNTKVKKQKVDSRKKVCIHGHVAQEIFASFGGAEICCETGVVLQCESIPITSAIFTSVCLGLYGWDRPTGFYSEVEHVRGVPFAGLGVDNLGMHSQLHVVPRRVGNLGGQVEEVADLNWLAELNTVHRFEDRPPVTDGGKITWRLSTRLRCYPRNLHCEKVRN